MSLYKRLHEAQGAPDAEEEKVSPLETARQRIHEDLILELGPILADRTLTDDDRSEKVTDAVKGALARERTPLSSGDREVLLQELIDEILGYGPLDALIRDTDVTDILVNGPGMVYCERRGKLEKTDLHFVDVKQLRRIIDKIVSQVGRRVDEVTPFCDARLPDGSRVNAVIAPVAIDGPFLTIRKFSEEQIGVEDLIRFKTLSADVARFLQACILGRLNVIVTGGSSSGKTTLLNVLSSFIPGDERIITVEDAKELQLSQEHVLALESRPPNVDGKGEISIRDLVKNTLRMRPDRIVVGEVRGGESLDMLQAMNTGHDGSLTTMHANAPRDSLNRLETLVLMSGLELPVRAIREQIASAIHLVIQMSRLRDGTRRITHITEVQGMEGEAITIEDIFVFEYGHIDDAGNFHGKLKPTGYVPKFMEELEDHGIKLGPEVFLADDGPALEAAKRELAAGGTSGGGGPDLFTDDAAAEAAPVGAAAPSEAPPPKVVLFKDDVAD